MSATNHSPSFPSSLSVANLKQIDISPSYADSSAKIDFTGDWQENVTGELVPSGKFTINYE